MKWIKVIVGITLIWLVAFGCYKLGFDHALKLKTSIQNIDMDYQLFKDLKAMGKRAIWVD